MIDLTDANFDEEVLHSDAPVLVDFGAGWCPPCRAMDPIVEELSQTYASTVSRNKTWRHVTMSTACRPSCSSRMANRWIRQSVARPSQNW
ncbi:MAG TPA: hypothetical protein DIC52_08995 [Candidatus Latescibacteria bacterium]|nr:hypothetical protein [Candidatus Latescibacterota bacterium]